MMTDRLNQYVRLRRCQDCSAAEPLHQRLRQNLSVQASLCYIIYMTNDSTHKRELSGALSMGPVCDANIP